MRESRATSVSTPRIVSLVSLRRAARALRRAFSTATSAGSPRSSSTTWVGRTVNDSPKRSSSLRLCGEAEASTSGGFSSTTRRFASAGELGKEQGSLARGRLGRIRAVDHVLAHLDREVTANRSGRGLERVGRTDYLAGRLDSIDALQDHRHDRSRCYEVDKLAEEGLLGVLAVVTLSRVPGDRHVTQGEDAQALALEAGNDLARERAGEGVRLYEDQRAVHGVLWDLDFRRFAGAACYASVRSAWERTRAYPPPRCLWARWPRKPAPMRMKPRQQKSPALALGQLRARRRAPQRANVPRRRSPARARRHRSRPPRRPGPEPASLRRMLCPGVLPCAPAWQPAHPSRSTGRSSRHGRAGASSSCSAP